LTATAEQPAEVGDGQPSRLERLLAAFHLDPEFPEHSRAAGQIGIAVLLDGDGARSTWDASGEPSYTACEMEVLVESGPGTAALESRGVVRVPDLAAETRWAVWRKVAQQLRWRSALAAPVLLEEGLAAVIVYSTDRFALDAPGLLDRMARLGDATQGH
jgi:hypothetical protein